MRQFLQGQKVLQKYKNQGQLWISGIKFAQDSKSLEDFKISAIGSICARQVIVPKNITHQQWQVEDHRDEEISQIFEQTLTFIKDQRNKGNNVLIHCTAGMSRSAAVVVAYLMQTNNWTFNKSYYFLKQKRSFVKINSGFINQLKQFEQKRIKAKL